MNLIQRVQDILLKPKATWVAITDETDDVKSLYTNYLVFLAAIPAVAGFVGMSLVGVSMFGSTFRTPFVSGLASMVVGYVMSLVMVYVMALIANGLAPTFGGEKNFLSAVKLMVYGSTAAMVGGIFSIIPMLSLLGLVATIYTIYLIHTGILTLMKAPESKAMGYTVALVACGLVAGLTMAAVSTMLIGAPHHAMMGSAGTTDGDANISIKVPGTEISINTRELEEAAQKMEQASEAMEAAQASGDQEAASKAMGAILGAAAGNDGAKPLAADKLQTFVPEALGGMPRTEIEARTDNAMGMSFSSVNAVFEKDSQSIDVKIQDLGAVKLLAMGMAAWASSTVNKETTDEVERVYKKGGVAFKENYRKDGSFSEMSMMLGNGVLMEVTGNGVPMDALRSAIASIDTGSLGALAR